MKMLEHSPHAYIIFDKKSKKILNANHLAFAFYAELGRFTTVDSLFIPVDRENPTNSIKEQLKDRGFAQLMDMKSRKNNDDVFLCDIDVGILDEANNLLYLVVKPNENQHHKNDNALIDAIQDLCVDLLYRVDIPNKILYRNEATAKAMGMPHIIENFPESVGTYGVIHPDDIETYKKYGRGLLQGIEGKMVARMRMKSGNYEYHEFVSRLVYDDQGNHKEMVGKAVNVQKMMDSERQATVDTLTKVFSKSTFETQVKEIFARSSETSNHALFFVDLDDFKGINENLGHSFGDFLLSTVGKRLKTMVRESDMIGRVGGDQFVVFLNGFADEKLISERGQMILETLSREYVHYLGRSYISCSVGIALYPQHGKTYEEIYEKADLALYHSKNNGKSLASLYSIDLKKD